MTSPKPLPGTNLVQLRASVGAPADGASQPIAIEQIVLRCAFASPLSPPYDAWTRTIRPAYGTFPAPWALNEIAASAFQVVQPGAWGEGLEVARGPQRLALEVTLGGGASGVVSVLSDGSDAFDIDWQAPRDYSLDVAVIAVDGQWRLDVTQVWPPVG